MHNIQKLPVISIIIQMEINVVQEGRACIHIEERIDY